MFGNILKQIISYKIVRKRWELVVRPGAFAVDICNVLHDLPRNAKVIDIDYQDNLESDHIVLVTFECEEPAEDVAINKSEGGGK